MRRFKRGDGPVAVNGKGSPATSGGGGSRDRDRADTDPDTCFEVFKNHWKQALEAMAVGSKKAACSSDDVQTVVHNFEQMMTLLVGEEGIDGMPGPILYFLMEKEVLEQFCNWCSGQRGGEHQDKLCMDQLHMYELLISQSHQLLLIHRQVIRPLLRLLMACAEPRLPGSGSEELQFRLVLVLHQICTCISQETVILESFFSTEADHGPAKFLIFSLLIPYIHQEGPIGQRARDALLLLMTLSAVHPHIGHYIADNSDFCPVLATGLSGLYSSLPRKITPPSEDWFALTEGDCQRIVDLQMFLNSLEFCNAVVQVAHPLVRDQLIKFIYTGFLLPVLGPALHQDISGLPIPLMDTAMFMNSRDEVMTATAYLDLFLRRISEPHLIRAFLRFVLTERHDEMQILESLITRINSNTKLSLVSLSLFHTLVDMNCEEVMFHLVFKYLIPCTHVMVSQRRAVRDLDLYGKSAEKFLSLRPVCCMTYPSPSPAPLPPGLGPLPQGTPSPLLPGRALPPSRTDAGRSASVSTPADLAKPLTRQEPRRRSFFQTKKGKKKLETLPEDEQKQASDSASTTSAESVTSAPGGEDQGNVSESSYPEYLLQARSTLEQCSRACRHWSAPYDGERPPPDSDLEHPKPPPPPPPSLPVVANGSSEDKTKSDGGAGLSSSSSSGVEEQERGRSTSSSSVKLSSHGHVPEVASGRLPDATKLEQETNNNGGGGSSGGDQKKPSGASSGVGSGSGDGGGVPATDSAPPHHPSSSSSVISETLCNTPPLSSSSSSSSSSLPKAPSSSSWRPSSLDLEKLHSCLGDLDSFLACLNGLDVSGSAAAAAVAPSGGGSGGSLEESLASLDALLSEVGSKHGPGHEASARKSLDATRLSPPRSGDPVGVAPDNQKSAPPPPSSSSPPPPSADASASTAAASLSGSATTTKSSSSATPGTTTTASSAPPPPVRRTLPPPKTLGLASTKDISLGGLPRAQPVVRYSNAPPNIGPFLAAVFGRLEGMVQNTLYSNLLLTGLVSRLAAYPQPLLRSFLLNVNLVFQPSVKSLVQVLSSVRQKVDSYAVTTRNFSGQLCKARLNLKMREDSLLFPSQAPPATDLFSGGGGGGGQAGKPRAATVSEMPTEKKNFSLADLFRRSPKPNAPSRLPPHQKLQRVVVGGGLGYRFINSHQQRRRPGQEVDSGGPAGGNSEESSKTLNAVYCALLLEEFLKELAALSLEQSVLHRTGRDEGYVSS